MIVIINKNERYYYKSNFRVIKITIMTLMIIKEMRLIVMSTKGCYCIHYYYFYYQCDYTSIKKILSDELNKMFIY